MFAQIAGYIPNSLVNGEGIRDVVFFSGCNHHCSGCHNPEAQDFNYGEAVDIDDLVARAVKNKPMIDGVTISGGDPFYQYGALLTLCKKLKEQGLNIWVYTGFKYAFLKNEGYKDIFNYIDVLVDDVFIEDLKDPELKYRGSKNQIVYYFENGKLLNIL